MTKYNLKEEEQTSQELEYESVGWRNRIVGYAEVDPHSLLANEDNWRIHPLYQRQVVGTELEEVGWVQDVVVNVRQAEGWQDDERLETVLDGHLRVLLALQTDQPAVPVKYIDLTPEEEKRVLLILDPSSSLAAADNDRLRTLLEAVRPIDETTKQFLVDLADKHKVKFEEESTLTSEDEFGNFSEYGGDDEENYVDFKFGDYSAKIHQSTYDIFVEQVNLTKEETGEVMLDNVIRQWFTLNEEALPYTFTEQNYGKSPYDEENDNNNDSDEEIKLP